MIWGSFGMASMPLSKKQFAAGSKSTAGGKARLLRDVYGHPRLLNRQQIHQHHVINTVTTQKEWLCINKSPAVMWWCQKVGTVIKQEIGFSQKGQYIIIFLMQTQNLSTTLSRSGCTAALTQWVWSQPQAALPVGVVLSACLVLKPMDMAMLDIVNFGPKLLPCSDCVLWLSWLQQTYASKEIQAV